MEIAITSERNRGRIEKRTAFVSSDIEWLQSKADWADLCCTGAIHSEFTTKSGTSDEWHYDISRKSLTAQELLRHARAEWRVESMH